MAKNNDSDIAFITALAKLLNSEDLGEVEVLRQYGEDDALEVRIAKQSVAPAIAAPAAPIAAPVAQAPATATPAAEGVAALPASNAADVTNAISAPMVGTVYLSPEPGAAPYINVGDKVSEGDPLLIIEAMKTMNQIPSPKSGTVVRILVDDGAPVEYGDPLVVIE